jgi:ATP-dependent Clp protease protease subunit
MRVVQEQCEIHTLGIGKVMSAGVLLLAAGSKGKRRVGRHCRVMLHSVSSGHIGELHNLKNELEEVQIMQNNYISALATETDMTEKHIKNLINKKVNVYLTAQEAVDLGIADEVV